MVLFWFLREEGKSKKATLVVRLLMVDRRGVGGKHTAQSDCSNQGMCRRISKEEEGRRFSVEGPV
jgi:hypothetical protein